MRQYLAYSAGGTTGPATSSPFQPNPKKTGCSTGTISCSARIRVPRRGEADAERAAAVPVAGTPQHGAVLVPEVDPELHVGVSVRVLPRGGAPWNELVMALVLLSSPGHRTVPLSLLNFQGQFTTNFPALSAGILIALLPILVGYGFLQRWIVSGLTAGAVKG